MKGLGKISQNQVASDQVSYVEVDEDSAGQRIDNFLLRVCKGVPKSHIYRILRSGEVRVNKGRIDAQYRLVLGDVVRVPPIRTAQADAGAAVAAPVPAAQFPVLYEDEALLVIDKPAGVAVHGGSGVAFGVIEQLREARPHAKFLELVHRLDRETSGILMLAKKRAALVGLHEQIRENRMDKRYYACVHGDWASDWGRRRAVKEPLHKFLTPEGERRVRVQPDGQPSHTVFNLVERWPEYALLEAELKTGRTHQIRVHLAHLGLPIVGDAKYGDFALNKALARPAAKPGIKRMFLHAYRLKLVHPITGETLQFEAPLPAECRRFVESLRAQRDGAEGGEGAEPGRDAGKPAAQPE
ncbi:RluA family pseudouridine synthase [Paraburkholderia acidipaludis]|uniref:RluA family pseudouridine synthase n=1 Tax=Paraburkholderia acidipaludis TaxID=660537 RepID=UPI0005BB8C70|nr:RluA family pseudouridine synthase [Paraburkholderia acidipaludis]